MSAFRIGSSSATTGTSTSGTVTIYDGLDSDSALIALSANQGRILKELIQSMSGGTSINIVIDEDSLVNNQILVYNSTTKQWENKNNEGVSEITKLKDVQLTTLSDKQILQYDAESNKWINKTFDLESSAMTQHIADTVKHITSTERTNWNDANTKKHIHSNKDAIDKITDAKINNWDGVVTNWDKAFYFDKDGNLRVKLNLIGEKEVSAYGRGSSTSTGAITIVDNLTSTLTDAALSANQGRVLKDMIDSANLGEFDLSGYSKTSHTHSNYSVTSHTHSNYSTTGHTHTIANITNLQSTLDGKSGTGHTHSAYSPTSHTHSNYSVTSHTHSNYSTTGHTHSAYYDSAISRTKNTVLAAPNGSDGTATFRSLVAADIPSLAISKITNLQSSLDAKSGTGHSHSNYSPTGHTHSISNITNLQSTLDGKSGTGHSHSNYSVTSHTHSLSALTSTAHTHSVIVGSYTSNGGQQAPNYFGKNRVGALMMNTTVNGNSDYKDWLFMDCYSGNDVGGGVAFGVNRQNLGAYIMRSASGRTSWAASAELIGTHNYTKYCATSGHTHNYAGSSSAGGAATSANKVNSSLSWSGYNSGSFNGSGAASFVIPSNTNQLTNGANFITTAATVNAANKLATARTLWGQSFSGTANVSGNMTGVGSISASGNITTSAEVTAHSDKRLKDNIQPLENRGYITPYTYIKDGKQSIGFIAQDMQELYPELVSVDESTEEKYLSVNYMQYTAVLQQQIIDLKKEIDELKQIIKEIKK